MQVDSVQSPGYVGNVQGPEAARAPEPAQRAPESEARPVETADDRGAAVDVQA
jgi:hypothetical protein